LALKLRVLTNLTTTVTRKAALAKFLKSQAKKALFGAPFLFPISPGEGGREGQSPIPGEPGYSSGLSEWQYRPPSRTVLMTMFAIGSVQVM
jgi:hypothetical protein